MRTLLVAAFLVPLLAVERWDAYEMALSGPSAGNPYLDVKVGTHFRFRNRVVNADGFDEGASTYRIRFMLDEPGE